MQSAFDQSPSTQISPDTSLRFPATTIKYLLVITSDQYRCMSDCPAEARVEYNLVGVLYLPDYRISPPPSVCELFAVWSNDLAAAQSL